MYCMFLLVLAYILSRSLPSSGIATYIWTLIWICQLWKWYSTINCLGVYADNRWHSLSIGDMYAHLAFFSAVLHIRTISQWTKPGWSGLLLLLYSQLHTTFSMELRNSNLKKTETDSCRWYRRMYVRKQTYVYVFVCVRVCNNKRNHLWLR